MADSTVVIPPDVDTALNERATIWTSFDQASASLQKIKELGGQIGGATDGIQPADSLTAEGSPPVEVAAVLTALEAELAGIQQAEADILKHEKEIASHKTMRTVLIVIGILVLLIIIFAIAQSVGH